MLPGDQFFISAFWDLSTERQIGMSIGQIPHSKILEYARDFALDGRNINQFRTVIRILDLAWIKWTNEEMKS